MPNKGLAKSKPIKTIKEHTVDLLEQYKILKKLYQSILEDEEWEILEYAIKYHDLGKVNTKFQNKIYKKIGEELLEDNIDGEEIPHNFLSPCFIDIEKIQNKYGFENTRILVSSVYYHHDREKKPITNEYIEDLKKQKNILKDYFDLEFKNINSSFGRYIINRKCGELFKTRKYIMIKGLLNKADYVASLNKAGVNIEEPCKDKNGQNVNDRVVQITKENYNGNYRDVQKYMMNNRDENLVVVSYTGSGKTEAALLWSGTQKAFYTLPLKVSINAIYERINNKIQYDKVLLLHSDAYSFYQEHNESEINSYDRARRLSAPLLITTVDQLFKIVFRYQGYEEILSTLSYSKIVLDEIQMYSPQMLAYILYGLKMITEVGGKFAIITATFPPILYNIMDKLKIQYKKQTEAFIPHISNRHKVKILENDEFDFEQIKQIGKEKKVLIIVNTVKRAQQIFEKLSGEAYLLHSHYIKSDRNKIEEKILNFGDREKNNECGIWISTQIVEASLDIDFDVLFTECCSIDSLLQRMGRVYRKRLFSEKEPNVYILDNRNGVPYIIDKEIYDFTVEEIKKYDNQNLSEATKQEMINNIFDLEKNKNLKKSNYYKTIKNELDNLENIITYEISKDIIQSKFRNIQNVNLIPDNIFDELYDIGKIEEWEEALKDDKKSVYEKIQVKNEIQRYIISVRYSPKVSYDKGNELFYKGSNIYRTQYKYEFDSSKLKGKGLIMKNIIGNSGYFDE